MITNKTKLEILKRIRRISILYTHLILSPCPGEREDDSAGVSFIIYIGR